MFPHSRWGNPGRQDNVISDKPHYGSLTQDDFLRATCHITSGFWFKTTKSKTCILKKENLDKQRQQGSNQRKNLPLFDYCAVFWDSCGQGSKSYLDKLNQRAACIIEDRAVKSDELSTVFGWPHLQAHRNLLKSVLVHKCINGLAPSYLLSEFRHAHQIHSHFTRQRDQLRLPMAKTTKYQGSFRINGARAYNFLPSNIRSATDFNTFKSLGKQHFKRQCVQSL